jgi:hypothetical protein
MWRETEIKYQSSYLCVAKNTCRLGHALVITLIRVLLKIVHFSNIKKQCFVRVNDNCLH